MLKSVKEKLTTKKIIIFKPELTKKPILSKTNGAYKLGPYISSNQVLCANSIELVTQARPSTRKIPSACCLTGRLTLAVWPRAGCVAAAPGMTG